MNENLHFLSISTDLLLFSQLFYKLILISIYDYIKKRNGIEYEKTNNKLHDSILILT